MSTRRRRPLRLSRLVACVFRAKPALEVLPWRCHPLPKPFFFNGLRPLGGTAGAARQPAAGPQEPVQRQNAGVHRGIARLRRSAAHCWPHQGADGQKSVKSRLRRYSYARRSGFPLCRWPQRRRPSSPDYGGSRAGSRDAGCTSFGETLVVRVAVKPSGRSESKQRGT